MKNLAEKKKNNVLLRIENLEAKIKKIEKLLKGKTFARFKYVKANYKYIKDIYAELKKLWEEVEKIKKVINERDKI